MTPPGPPLPGLGQLWRNLDIGRKLGLGFGVLVIITLAVVGWSFFGSAEATENIDRTEELRVPTALDSAGAQANLLRMLASTRGYLALGDQQYRDDYSQARLDFEADLAKLEERSAAWTNPVNNRRLEELQKRFKEWSSLPDELFDLRDDQLRREPAFQILIKEVAPLSGQVLQDTNNLIDMQAKLAASPDRVGSDDVGPLKDMANFQGSFAQMISGLRSYATTRRESFKFEYETALRINQSAWERLANNRDSLPPLQQNLLDNIETNRAAFLEFPPQMFEILEDPEDRWQVDLYRFRTEVVPPTEAMLKLLDEMTADQQASLKTDLAAGRAGLASVRVFILVGGSLAVALGIILAFFFRTNIAGPIVRLTGVAQRIKEGDLEAQAVVESGDEIGRLAGVFNRMATQLRATLDGLRQEVAERQRAEEELRQSEERFRELFENANDIVYTTTLAGKLTSFNRAAERISGYSRTEARKLNITQLVAPEYKPLTRPQRVVSSELAGRGVLVYELELLTKDGRRVPLEASTRLIYQNGQPIGMQAIARDITERKRAEEVLRQHRDHLEELVAGRTEHLQREIAERKRAEESLKLYAAELERSNSELQDFAYVASHDLREPLRKIQAFGSRLGGKYKDVLDDRGQDYLARMQNAAARMQTLINDMLVYSRVTTKAQPFISLDLARIARDVVTDLDVRIEESGGRVEIGELPTIDADALQMRQLLQNLISNALKFHRPDESPLVKVSYQLLDGQEQGQNGNESGVELCQILVEDKGLGFDEKYLDRSFGMFQRLHGRGSYEGTGVGLAICRKIVERHGGTITARSAPGQGTTFIATLPVKQAVVKNKS